MLRRARPCYTSFMISDIQPIGTFFRNVVDPFWRSMPGGPRGPTGMLFQPGPKPDPRVIREHVGNSWNHYCSKHPNIGKGEGYQVSRGWQMYKEGVDWYGRGPEYGFITGGYTGGGMQNTENMISKTNHLHSGTVSHWNPVSGVGFIKPDNGGKEIFCHKSSFAGRLGLGDEMIVGEKVTFHLQFGVSIAEYHSPDARAAANCRAANVMGPGVGQDDEVLNAHPFISVLEGMEDPGGPYQEMHPMCAQHHSRDHLHELQRSCDPKSRDVEPRSIKIGVPREKKMLEIED